jgi:hypothetical protein
MLKENIKDIKKDTKKNSKNNKIPKEKKLKLYCGILDPIPSGYKLGSMQECFDAGKVMYYGIKKVDSIVLNSNKKKEETDVNALQIKKAGLLGKHNNLKKKYENAKVKEDKEEIKKDIEKIVKEINKLTEQIKNLKNN